MSLIERLDDARSRWNVLRHPFYVRWERGELTADELAEVVYDAWLARAGKRARAKWLAERGLEA